MKVSNNALNFLLAQYRAIFKRAYVKGLASAVLLTAGLAAGQAQAGTLSDVTDNLAKDQVILIGTADESVDAAVSGDTIQLDSNSAAISSGWNAQVIINSGAASTTGNYIKASGGNAITLNSDGTGTLTINLDSSIDDATANGLAIIGNAETKDAALSINLESVNVARGTLSLTDAASGSVALAADTITIGTAPAPEKDAPAGASARATANPEAYVKLAASTKSATLGEAGVSEITVDGTGQLVLSGAASVATTVQGKSLAVKNGGLLLIEGGDTNKINIDLDVDANSSAVVKGGATGEFAGSTATVDGNLLVGTGATLNLTPASGDNSYGTVTVNGNAQIDGTVKLSQGTLKFTDGAQLHATGTAGGIQVTDDGSKAGTLKITKSAFESFLGSGAKFDSIAEDGSVTADGGTSNKGGISLSGNSSTNATLEITGEGTVVLSDYEFTGTGSASAGKIDVKSGTIAGNDLTIEKALGTAANLNLRANTLRLGSASYNSTGTDLKFDAAVAKDVILTSDSTGFGLKNSLTLDVTLNETVAVTDANDDGTITGNPVLSNASKPLTVKHGNYTLDGDLTLSNGKLLVTNGNLADPSKNIDTVLTLDQDLNITSAGGTIEVNGSGATGVETVLDISNVTLSFENGNSANAAINAYNDGTIRLKGEDLQTVIDSGLSSGAKVAISGGTIEVVDDLTIANTQIKNASAAEASKIVFTNNTNGAGTLQVDGTLTINSVDNIKLGDQSQVSADELVLNSSSDAAAIISGGNFTALSSVGGAKGINVSGASASLALGAFEQVSDNVWTAKSSSGTIKTDLTLSNGSISVQNGSWKGANQSLTIAGGTFTVGDAQKVDASGNTFATSLSLNKIAQTGASAKTTISTVGSVTTNSLTVSDGTFIVSGSMTVDGDLDSSVTSETPAKYGVALAADKITLGENANLTFGADATKAITVRDAKDATKGWISAVDGTFGKADPTATQTVINAAVGSTVTFEFDSGTSFGSEALAEFRKEIFGVAAGGNLAGFVNLGDAQIAGLTDAIKNNEIAYDDLQGYIDVDSDFTTEALQNVKVTGIDSSSELRGSLGSLSSTELGAGEQIAVDGNLALNNAAANGGKFAANAAGEVLGLDVTQNVQVNLNNGGEIGTVSFDNKGSFVVASENGTTTIGAIDGAKAKTQFITGTATVKGTTKTAQLTTAAGTNTTFEGEVTVGKQGTATDVSSLAGNTTFKAAATFAQDAVVANTGSADFAGDVTFEGTAEFYGDTTVDGTATTKSDITIEDDAVVTINNLVTQGNIFVGSLKGDHAGAGTLSVETLRLNGNELVVDPAWDNATGLAFVGVNKFTDATTSDAEAGLLNGPAYALQNSILSIGNKDKDDVLAIFDKYINAQGNLSNDKDGVGAIVYVAKNVEVAANGKIVADKTQNRNTYDDQTVINTYGSHSVYIGDNSVLGVRVSAANGDKAAITFKDQADIHAEKAGKILLTGNYDQSDRIFLFDDSDHNIAVSSGGITVESINGLLKYTYNGGSGDALYFDISDMHVETERAESAFSATSSPVHESLVAYGTGNTDWRNDDKQKADEKKATKTHGAVRSDIVAVVSGNKTTYYYKPEVEGEAPTKVVEDKLADRLTTINVLNPDYVEGSTDPKASSKYIEKVAYKAYNPLLSAINNVQANSGISAESAARMADFAGVAQVALKAGNSTSDAISGRMGVGAQNSAITYANNGQGAGLWVTPIYMNSDSDGFEAQGISYGTDINLYGVALGGDYTLANGIRVGAMFNVGSGDVDGQGAGSNVSSDFDYYGLGLYAGYTMGQFSIVGDLSYTAVDNDVEANTEFADIGKLETSLDSSNISFGVTGAYAFDTAAGVQVTPHVGLRYSYIDIDDYTVGSKKGAIGSYSADSLSVFSIPVGVTIASEFNAGSWSVKPSFDITLTGNFGDDENEGTFHWNGVENIDCGLNSEIFDNFTYGATLGVAAQSASGISLGLSVGYTGSSNVDDFGVNANARFTF